MINDYGYIRRTEGVDGDHVDVFMGPNKDAADAFVITTMSAPGFKKIDEQKVMLGFDNEQEAKDSFLNHYDDKRFFGYMKKMPMDEFKRKVKMTYGKPKLLKSFLWMEN